jgi:hypothetical protein
MYATKRISQFVFEKEIISLFDSLLQPNAAFCQSFHILPTLGHTVVSPLLFQVFLLSARPWMDKAL